MMEGKEDNYGTQEIWGKQRERTNKGMTVRDERNAKKNVNISQHGNDVGNSDEAKHIQGVSRL